MRNLIALRQIGVEVVLARKNCTRSDLTPECKPELTAYNACQASTTAANWVCTGDLLGLSPYAPACDDLLYTWLACAGF